MDSSDDEPAPGWVAASQAYSGDGAIWVCAAGGYAQIS